MKRPFGIGYYLRTILGWTVLLTAAGAAAGALLYPFVGALAGLDRSLASLAGAGAHDIGFIAFIWAPGFGLVMAFHRAYLAKKRAEADPEPPAGQPP